MPDFCRDFMLISQKGVVTDKSAPSDVPVLIVGVSPSTRVHAYSTGHWQ